MTYEKLPLEAAADARGIIVVIDVLRAFTTAAVAFSRGVERIYPVSTVSEAFACRDEDPAFLIMGEENWFPVPGFDFSNSPVELAAAAVSGRSLVQRTSAGTQGLLRVPATSHLYAASFVCAKATATAIRGVQPEHVTFILTGTGHGNRAQEDEACADYLIALLEGDASADEYLERVADSDAGRRFLDPQSPNYAPDDLVFCARADIFPFAMRAKLHEGRMWLQAEVS